MTEALFSLVLLFALILVSAQARSTIYPKPQPLTSFKINTTTTHPLTILRINTTTTTTRTRTNAPEKAGSCSYTVVFTTSCSSPSYTRDQISLSFGDAYGYQVYVPRLDDPRSGAFEACSVDTYDITGPCTYDVCYLYVYRSGYDGWKLKSVEVYGYNTRSISFYYNTNIPRDVWYGFNYCNGVSAST